MMLLKLSGICSIRNIMRLMVKSDLFIIIEEYKKNVDLENYQVFGSNWHIYQIWFNSVSSVDDGISIYSNNIPVFNLPDHF